MDNMEHLSPEHGLVQRVVGASIQLQKEEGFSILEEQEIVRFLGINWYQATSLNQACDRLDSFLKEHKTEPTKEVALVCALKALFSELLPTLFAFELGKDPSLFMPDQDSLLIRLRHHFLLEVSYQDDYLIPRIAQISQTSRIPSSIAKNSFGVEVWFRNVESAVLLVLNELGLNRKFMSSVLSGDVNYLIADPSVNKRERILLGGLVSALVSVRQELQEDYEKKSGYLRPSQLGVFTPTVADIARLIRSYIDEGGQVEMENEDVSPDAELNSRSKDVAKLLMDFIKSGGK